MICILPLNGLYLINENKVLCLMKFIMSKPITRDYILDKYQYNNRGYILILDSITRFYHKISDWCKENGLEQKINEFIKSELIKTFVNYDIKSKDLIIDAFDEYTVKYVMEK